MEPELLARDVGEGLQRTLNRLAALVSRLAQLAGVVGAATFATGWWIFDGSRPAWIVLGGVLCLAPVAAALMAWFLIRTTARLAPGFAQDVKMFAETSSNSVRVLLDHDTGRPIGGRARSLGAMRQELNERRKQLPALFAGVRAITSVPGLAAVTLGGIVVVGAVGTILLIGGLID